MSDLSWLPRESGIKNHHLWEEEHFSSDAPGVMFEKRPILDPSGAPVDGLFSAWIILNNPTQYNSYTTEMVKGVIAGFHRASADSSVVAAVFTAMGDKAFCTGGNTKEYAEYYAGRPNEYGLYMDCSTPWSMVSSAARNPPSAGSTACASPAARRSAWPAIWPCPAIWPSSARPDPSTAAHRTAAAAISCPGCCRWNWPCGTVSPARCGVPTR
jgi:hypothetical protein